MFAQETGYATPKIDVRGAAFNAEGHILLVRETADAGRWPLPGGWADVNHTPAESVIKEIREESGFNAQALKLAAIWNRTRQRHASGVFSCCKMFFICQIIGGALASSLETSEATWFPEQALPSDLSHGRVLPDQLHRIFAHARDPALPTEFE